MKLAPPSQGGGMALLTPAAACGMDPAPRITNINGTQFGIEFQPGSQLNIAGCGFGKGGQVYLSGVGTTVQLKIDSWDDSNIHAHIDASLGGVSDFDGVKVNIKPNGLPIISSIETNKFKAARVQFVLAIPPTVAGTYSQIYGPPKTSNMNVFTTVSREKYYSKYCPAVSDQPSQMTDSWPVDFLANGFDVIGVNYTNHTLQTNWNTQKVQWVLVGGDPGSAKYDAMQKRVVVTFQANSMYVKNAGTLEAIVLPIELIHNLMDSGSACTSSYTVSLTVSGPRGISPLK